MAMVRQFDEDELINKVLEVFWQKGWQSTAMKDLSEAAQVQRGSLYHAYGDKEQLFLLAFTRYSKQVLDEAIQVLENGNDVSQILMNFFDAAISNMLSDGKNLGCFTTQTMIETEYLSETVRSAVQDFMQALEKTLEEALQQEHLQAQLNLPVSEAVKLIMTFGRGIAVMERLYPDAEYLQNLGQNFIKILVQKNKNC